MYCKQYVLVILLFTLLQDGIEGRKNLWLRKLEMCDLDYNYPIKFLTSVKIHNEIQSVNLTAIVNTPLGQDQAMNATFEYSLTGDGFMPLFKFARSDLCDFFNKDLGAFWFEIQRQIAVPSRSCPVPVGRYNVRNYQLPYSKLQFPLPSGFIRSILNIVENKTNRMISCLYTLMEVV